MELKKIRLAGLLKYKELLLGSSFFNGIILLALNIIHAILCMNIINIFILLGAPFEAEMNPSNLI